VGGTKGSAAGWKPKVARCQPCHTYNIRALLIAGERVYREESRSGVDLAQIFRSCTEEYFGTALGLCPAKCSWQSTILLQWVSIL